MCPVQTVTHVSGTNRHPCVRPLTDHQFRAPEGRAPPLSSQDCFDCSGDLVV